VESKDTIGVASNRPGLVEVNFPENIFFEEITNPTDKSNYIDVM